MTRRIRTALYGDQAVESVELDLLHTPALQRLYELHQLGFADRIFVDASHSRLHHVLGVLQQVDNIVRAIDRNLEKDGTGRRLVYSVGEGMFEEIEPVKLAHYVQGRRTAVRLMGMLHDLTHAPFGHTLEDEVALYPQKHDDPNRQADAFYRLLLQYIGWIISDILDTETDSKPAHIVTQHAFQWQSVTEYLARGGAAEPPAVSEIVDLVSELGDCLCSETFVSRELMRAPGPKEMERLFLDLLFAMRALLWLDEVHKPLVLDAAKTYPSKAQPPKGGFAFEQLLESILRRVRRETSSAKVVIGRDAFLLDVIGNTICADLLDYAKRDAHFAGLRLDYDVDRIVDNFTVVDHRAAVPVEKEAEYRPVPPLLRTAISVFSHKYRVDVPGELLNLLQVRFYVYQRVLYHQTKSIAGAMLGSALQLMGWGTTIPSRYRFTGDDVFLSEMRETVLLLEAVVVAAETKGFGKAKDALGFLPSQFVGGVQMPTVSNAKNLLSARRERTLVELKKEIVAARTLLMRLGARRYFRPVFRLMPDLKPGGLNVSVDTVAKVFMRTEKRTRAERLIERRSGLPVGSIVIHCPSASGPRKIAEILIWGHKDGKGEAFPLREIGNVNPPLFTKHQEAITALEGMYASMWRLVVAVAPQYLGRRAQVIEVTKEILSCMLSGIQLDHEGMPAHQPREHDLVANDDQLQRELDQVRSVADEPEESVVLHFPDGTRGRKTSGFIRVAEAAVARLTEYDESIQSLVHEAKPLAAESESAESERLEELLKLYIKPKDSPSQTTFALDA